MGTTMTWGHSARRRGLALLAAFTLLASLITVFSPAAQGQQGNPPSVECASTDPAWNGDYWKVQINNGSAELNNVETNVNDDAIIFDSDDVSDGSVTWTNNHEDEADVFRVVRKEGHDEGDEAVNAIVPFGESRTLTLDPDISHITFCFTDEAPPPPPEPGQIIVEKLVTAGSDQSTAFSFTTDFAISDNTLAHGESGASGDLDAGTYAVSETVPAGWSLVSAVCDDGSDPAAIDLDEGEVVTCTFTNEQEISEPNPETDLEITKIDLVDPVVVSTDSPTALITYEVTVTNNGPELAENVVVTDTLPATLTYVSSSPAVGTCAHAGGIVTCELGDLAVGGSVLITIVVETEAVGEITDFSPLNVAEVSSDTEETNLENNVDDEETNIIEVLSLTFTDLEISKIDLVDPVVVDSDKPKALITYEVTVSNNGPELAENVVVTDTLPATLTYVSSSPAVGTCAHAGGIVTCELGDLAVGGSVKITIVVETEEVGKITDSSPLNVVKVSSDTDEANLANNVADEETNIVEVLDLVVLPFTGVDTAFMLTGAIMLLGAGLTLVVYSWRRELGI
jgi:uncharacterized repeat protein (TIGR01451 family)